MPAESICRRILQVSLPQPLPHSFVEPQQCARVLIEVDRWLKVPCAGEHTKPRGALTTPRLQARATDIGALRFPNHSVVAAAAAIMLRARFPSPQFFQQQAHFVGACLASSAVDD